MGVVVIRPWSILVDGDVALRCTELTPVAHAGSLRRFEAGREVTP